MNWPEVSEMVYQFAAYYQSHVFRIIILISIFTLHGCGGNDAGRVEVSGEVFLAGSVVKSGRVNFIPESGTKGPASGGEIADGRFLISQERGPVPGKYLVRVRLAPTEAAGSPGGSESKKRTRPPSKEEILSGTREVAADEEGEPSLQAQEAVEPSTPKFHVTVTSDGPNSFTLKIESADATDD